MKKFKVYITRSIPKEGIAILEKQAQVIIGKTKVAPTKKEIIRQVKDCDGMITLLTDKIDAEIMDHAPNLKVISNYAVGLDNIDIKAATEREIMVTNTPGVLTETTADLAWALLMATSRRIVEADQFVRDGKWKSWESELLLGQDIHHATLGIIGMGRIGFETARRGTGFSMRILYHNRHRNKKMEKDLGAKFVDLDTLLRESDFVSLHCPLTPETRNLISGNELSKMKRTAILINTSRGPVVDSKALYQALKKKTIAGAGLDVFELEPIEPSNPLLKLKNVVVAPHIGSASVQTRTKMSIWVANDLLAALNGKKPEHWANQF